MERKKIKAAFFDVDYTLYSHTQNAIPEKHKLALAKLKEQGIKVCLCTARAKPLIENLGLWDAFAWDGIIAGNASYIYDKDKNEIYKNVMEEAAVDQVYKIAKDKQISLFQAGNTMFVSDFSDNVQKVLDSFHVHSIEARSRQANDESSVISVCVNNPMHLDAFDHIPGIYAVHNPLSIDLIKEGLSKYEGIQILLEHFGYEKEEYIAFGDGMNDLEMLENAGIGVAMANGDARLLKKIKEHTTSCDEGGIYTYLVEHDIITGE